MAISTCTTVAKWVPDRAARGPVFDTHHAYLRRQLPLYTGGNALMNLPLGSAAEPHYDADDVLKDLLGEMAALIAATRDATLPCVE